MNDPDPHRRISMERLRQYKRQNRKARAEMPEPERLSDAEEFKQFYRRGIDIVGANLSEMNYLKYGKRGKGKCHSQ